MGFRFRKSFKVAPGVRVNLGKKSASVSFGVKGARHTISSTGRRTSSIGIPGTGLYYTKSKYAKKPGSKPKLTNNQEYVDPFQEVEEFNELIEYILSFHKECDYNYDWEAIAKEQPPFNAEEKGPNEAAALDKLNNYEPNVLGKFFKIFNNRHREELEEEVKKAREEDKKLYKAWENRRKISQSILKNDPKAYMILLEDIQFFKELSGFINSLKIQALEDDVMIIEYDINIDEVIPSYYKTLTKSGKLSIRKYNKTDYYAIVKGYVSSITFRIARNIFGLLPINTVIINTQTELLNTQVGRIDNITILSVKIDKNTLKEMNFDLIDPFDALNNFEHNVKFLKTKGFQTVEKLYESIS